MINVEEVYQTVINLVAKDKAGYVKNADFIRVSRLSEGILFRYYMENWAGNTVIPDGMTPFILQPIIPIQPGGVVAIPSDFANDLYVQFRLPTNNPSGGAPTVEEIEMVYLEDLELTKTLTSFVRKPNLAKKRLFWTYGPSNIQVYPKDLTGSVSFRYARLPVYALRAVTLDATNDQENYDVTNSTDYEWREQDRSNLVNLILINYGIEMRENEVVNWALSNRQVTNQIQNQ